MNGGWQLVENFRDLAVVDNSLVVFESTAFHEVRPVECPSGAFADSRFSVTGWIHGLPDEAGATTPELGGAFVRAKGVIEGRVANSLLVFPPGHSEAHALDETGQAVWSALEEGGDVDAIVARLAADGSDRPEETRADVEKALGGLLAVGAIEPA